MRLTTPRAHSGHEQRLETTRMTWGIPGQPGDTEHGRPLRLEGARRATCMPHRTDTRAVLSGQPWSLRRPHELVPVAGTCENASREHA